MRKPYRFLLASLVAGMPPLAMLAALALSLGYVPTEKLSSAETYVVVQWTLLVIASAYSTLVVVTYFLARALWFFGILSRASLIVAFSLLAVALGVMLGYMPGSFTTSLLAIGLIAPLTIISLLPAPLLWWRVAGISKSD